MGILAFRIHLFSRLLSPNHSKETSAQSAHLYKNFQVCPHCEKRDGPFIWDRLTEGGPVISRSDGATFHLVLGDRPISYPAERSSGKTEMKTVGFWYVRERRTDARESRHTKAMTETVVVILREPPRSVAALMRHIEALADMLAERLSRLEELATLYEFDGHRLQSFFWGWPQP